MIEDLKRFCFRNRMVRGKYKGPDKLHFVKVDGITYRTVAIKDLSIGDKVIFVRNSRDYNIEITHSDGGKYSNPLAGSKFNPLVNSNGRPCHNVLGEVHKMGCREITVFWPGGSENTYKDHDLALIELGC